MTDPSARGPSRVAWALRAAQVRGRFFLALVVAFLVIGRWDVLRTYWDRWTSPAARDPAMGAVSADTEYFCPMDPGVVTDWPAKCPVCFMALVRRPRGDMGPRPDGVLARVQLSPERVTLAGIRTEAVEYRPLAREIRSIGRFRGGRVTAEVAAEDADWLAPGQPAEIAADPPDGTPPTPARVREVAEASVSVEPIGASPASEGRYVAVTVRVPIASREPFRSLPSGEPPLTPGAPRSVYACPDHAETLGLEPGRCPKDGLALERFDLAANQRVAWWCPMHPEVASDSPGRTCAACGGMILVPRVLTHRPEGQVLAVPESAVVDTGTRRIVYAESMPGVFDAIGVTLGPRCGGFFPIVEGLDAGRRVASAGAFLIDAETRLNPALATAYFGSRRASSPISSPPAAPPREDPLAALTQADRELARAQAVCPVTNKALGSMGTPVAAEVGGRRVFLCCDGCRDAAMADPAKTLAKLKRSAPSSHHP